MDCIFKIKDVYPLIAEAAIVLCLDLNKNPLCYTMETLLFFHPFLLLYFFVVLQLMTYIHSVIVLGHKSFGFFLLCVALFYFFYINIVAHVTSRLGKGMHVVYDKAIGLVFIWWNSAKIRSVTDLIT